MIQKNAKNLLKILEKQNAFRKKPTKLIKVYLGQLSVSPKKPLVIRYSNPHMTWRLMKSTLTLSI